MNEYDLLKVRSNNLIEFYRNNPVVAASDLLNVELAPIQRIIFRSMWYKDYIIVVACRGLGKSFLQALLAALKAILYPGHRIGLIGSSFRQAKVIFREVEALYQRSPILREASTRGPVKSTDMCELRLRSAGKFSGSAICAIPLGSDGSKIRGQRFFTICVAGDTFIRTEKGLIPIENIVSGIDTKIETLDGLYYPGRYIRNPKYSMYRVVTSKGFEIDATPEHPLYLSIKNNYEFTKVKDLKVDDKLVINTFSSKDWPVKNYYVHKYIPVIKSKATLDMSVTIPKYVDEDLALFLGLLVSEGHVTQPSNIQFANKDVEVIETYMPLARKLFSKTPGIRYIIPSKYGEKSGYYDTQLSSALVRRYLKDIGLDYCLSKDKTIPFSILQSPLTVVCAFLRGLFEGDGCIQKNYKGRNRPVVSYTSISLNLVKQIQILLINLGIVSYFRVARRKATTRNVCYILSITGEDVFKYMDLIGFISSKKSDRIKEFNKEGNFKIKLNKDGYFIDKIKSIEKVDDAVSYDFTIANAPSFMSNCFVSHNCADEFAQIPEQIFNLVVKPMAATSHDPISNVKKVARRKKLKELGIDIPDDTVNNKIVMTSSGYFKVNHMWSRMCYYWKKIAEGDTAFAVHQAAHWDLPEGFLNKSNIEEAKANMPKFLFEMEYCGSMVAESSGFYKATVLESCVANKTDNYYTVKTVGSKGAEYIMAIDPARVRDSFAILIFEICEGFVRIVYATTYTGKDSLQTVEEIFRLRDKFRLSRIIMDSQGGGFSIKDLLQAGQGGRRPILDILDTTNYGKDGDLILQLFNPSPSTNTEANFTALNLLENQKLLFPGPPQHSNDEEDDIHEYINTLKMQILSISVTTNPNGTLNFNTQSAKSKKDLYSCFIMGCWIIRQLEKEAETPLDQELILSFGGIISPRGGNQYNREIHADRINNFAPGSRPIIVPQLV